MTQQMKNNLMAIILPACIKRQDNTTPCDVIWFANRIICELEDKGYFQENTTIIDPDLLLSYSDQH